MKLRTLAAITAAPVAVLAIAAAPASAAAHPRVYDFGHCTARGQDAQCITGGGNINRPASIWVNVHVSPDQKIDVYWDMVCSKGDSVSSRDGNFTVTSPVKSRLLPQPGTREDSCSVSASVSLHAFGARGSITAWLTATKR